MINEKDTSTISGAVVRSTLLFNCQVRTWLVSEINKIYTKVDKCYRYVWSSKNQAPQRNGKPKYKTDGIREKKFE